MTLRPLTQELLKFRGEEKRSGSFFHSFKSVLETFFHFVQGFPSSINYPYSFLSLFLPLTFRFNFWVLVTTKHCKEHTAVGPASPLTIEQLFHKATSVLKSEASELDQSCKMSPDLQSRSRAFKALTGPGRFLMSGWQLLLPQCTRIPTLLVPHLGDQVKYLALKAENHD